MLSVMSEMVREEILKRVKQAGVFSIIVDTTTDVLNLEQFSLVLRYINEEGETEERLIAMKLAHDSTGLGMFNVFCDICNKYNINWETKLYAQSYDGAQPCRYNILVLDLMFKKKIQMLFTFGVLRMF